MKIREIQEAIKDKINAIQTLVQGGCKAFAEDSRSVYDEANQWISEGKIAIVVVTPKFTRNGCAASGIPCDTELLIRIIEKPPLAAANSNALRALDVGEIIFYHLAEDNLQFETIDQAASTDRDGNTLITVTLTYNFAINLNLQNEEE